MDNLNIKTNETTGGFSAEKNRRVLTLQEEIIQIEINYRKATKDNSHDYHRSADEMRVKTTSEVRLAYEECRRKCEESDKHENDYGCRVCHSKALINS